MKIRPIICTIICLYAQSAYAKGGFIGNFAQGFSQSATPALQAKAQANAEADANIREKQAEVDILANQYQKCLDSTAPDITKINLFASMYNQSNQCEKSVDEDFLDHNPNTPAVWFITNKPDGSPETHSATKLESKHLRILINLEKKCTRQLLSYSGQKGPYITAQMEVVREAEAGQLTQLDNYVNGKIDRGELFKRRMHIWNTYQAKLKENFDKLSNVLNAKFAESKRYCNGQTAYLQQDFQHQDTMQAIQQQRQQQIDQQKEIEQLKQKVDDAQSDAWAAEAEASRAKLDAENNQQH